MRNKNIEINPLAGLCFDRQAPAPAPAAPVPAAPPAKTAAKKTDQKKLLIGVYVTPEIRARMQERVGYGKQWASNSALALAAITRLLDEN